MIKPAKVHEPPSSAIFWISFLLPPVTAVYQQGDILNITVVTVIPLENLSPVLTVQLGELSEALMALPGIGSVMSQYRPMVQNPCTALMRKLLKLRSTTIDEQCRGV